MRRKSRKESAFVSVRPRPISLVNKFNMTLTSTKLNDNPHIRIGVRGLIVKHDAVLLIEFDDENGLHYNLPGGGVQPGESLVEALQREAKEEACIEIEIGRLLCN
jgi:hypothetical protein